MTEIIDFHGHYFPLDVVDAQPRGAMQHVAHAWPLLTNIDAQIERSHAAGTDLKVVNAPLSSLVGSAHVPASEIAVRTNDAIAADLQRLDGEFRALATVDAFAGDAGAEEARRAVEELRFPGIVVDVTHGQQTIADPVARPVLAYAAQNGIPVFAHPVTPDDIAERFLTKPGGVSLARGTESALATLGLFSGRTLTELDGLRVVVAGLGAAAVLLASFLERSPDEDGAFAPQRRRLYVDTMGFDPATVRYLVDVIGADHVLVGSDWPIMWRDPSRERIEQTFAAAGLSGDDATLVASGNARDLLGVGAVATG